MDQVQETQELSRETKIEYLVRVIDQINSFLDVSENKNMYLTQLGGKPVFHPWVITLPEMIKHRNFALWLEVLDALADDLLITADGQTDLVIHGKLKDRGAAKITCVKMDSFGWLRGVVTARNFNYYFG